MSDTVADPNQTLIDAITDLTARMVSLERAPWQTIVTSGAALASGDIIMGGPSRVGCLLCDGSAVSRTDPTTGAGIFAVWGTTWGAGDGVSTFKLPDFRGMVPIGAGAGPGLTARTLGVTVGAETVTLTGAQSGIAQHLHTVAATTGSTTPGATGSTTPGGGTTGADGDHSHNITDTSVLTASGTSTWDIANAGGGRKSRLFTPATDTAPTHTHTYAGVAHTHTSAAHTHTLPDTDNVAAANAAQAHGNVQPSAPVNFWIKI